jgi:hypothetical protein
MKHHPILYLVIHYSIFFSSEILPDICFSEIFPDSLPSEILPNILPSETLPDIFTSAISLHIMA